MEYKRNLRLGVEGYTDDELSLNVYGNANVSGNIGIGTDTPTAKLDVAGDVNITGIVTSLSYTGSGVNLTGIVTSIVAGTNITISGSSGEVTINSSSSGGGETISPLLLIGA